MACETRSPIDGSLALPGDCVTVGLAIRTPLARSVPLTFPVRHFPHGGQQVSPGARRQELPVNPGNSSPPGRDLTGLPGRSSARPSAIARQYHNDQPLRLLRRSRRAARRGAARGRGGLPPDNKHPDTAGRATKRAPHHPGQARHYVLTGRGLPRPPSAAAGRVGTRLPCQDACTRHLSTADQRAGKDLAEMDSLSRSIRAVAFLGGAVRPVSARAGAARPWAARGTSAPASRAAGPAGAAPGPGSPRAGGRPPPAWAGR